MKQKSLLLMEKTIQKKIYFLVNSRFQQKSEP